MKKLILAASLGALVLGASSVSAAEGNWITIATSCDVNDMNPHLGNAAIYAQNYVYEGLTAYDHGEIVPCLAESWDISEDGKTYTFHLRQDVKFSDGTDFTAENVVKNYDAIINNDNRFTSMGAVSYLESYQAIDDYTFEMVLTQAYAPVLMDLSSVRPFRMLGDAGFMDDGLTVNGILEVIGTGPWMMTDYVENEYAVFEKNPYYWAETSDLEGFTLKVVTDSQTAISELEAGEVDMIYDMYESQLLDVDNFNALAAEGFNSFISDPVLTRALLFNELVAPLDDFNVRKALILALDRETMVQSVFGGLEELAQSYYWPGTINCNVGLEGYPYDVETAASLLDEAGWVLEDGADYRTKDGEELALEFYYDASNVVQTTLAQICQSEWKKIGVKVDIVGEEAGANINRIYSGEFMVGYSVSWGDPYDPHSTLMAMATEMGTAEYFSLVGMDNYDEFCEKVLAAPSTVNDDERQQLYSDAMHMIEDEYSVIPVSYQTNRAITQSNVSGVTFGFSNIMPLNDIVVE